MHDVNLSTSRSGPRVYNPSLTCTLFVVIVEDLDLTTYLQTRTPRNMAPAYPTRRLGKDGPEVTALGYGLMGLSVE